MSRKPPLVTSEEHDWAQYRIFIITTVENLTKEVDELKKTVHSLAIKVAVITALICLGGQEIIKAITTALKN